MHNNFKIFRNIILLIILAIFIRMILMFGYILYLPSIFKFGDYIDSSIKYIPNFRREYENDFNSIIKILDKAYEENSEESLFYIGEDGSIWRSYADSYTVINGHYISSEKYLELSEQEKNMIKKLKNSHNYSENGFEYICRFENNYRFNINETTYYELVYLRDDTKENVKNLKERNSHWADAVVKLAPHWYQVAGPH